VYDLAIGKAIDNVQEMKVNLAQMIAERKQVVNTITNIVQRLAQAAISVKRRDYRGVMDALGLARRPKAFSGSLSKDWLAVQYGWRPLLADIKGLAEIAAESQFKRPIKIRAQGYAKRSTDGYTASTDLLGLVDGAEFTFEESETRVKVILEFFVYNDWIREGNRLGLDNPLLLAYELTPYSFVLDWLLPVSEFIKRLNYDSGLIYERGLATTFSSQKSQVVVRSGGYMSGGLQCAMSGGTVAQATGVRVDRDILLTLPRAPLPGFKDPVSTEHFFNALALLTNALQGNKTFKRW
jgi:hypothetical protein